MILAECYKADELRGALYRGYCSKENEKKVLDATLIDAMVNELASLESVEGCPAKSADSPANGSVPANLGPTNTASNAIALLEECITNGNNSQEALWAWFNCERSLIEQAIIDGNCIRC